MRGPTVHSLYFDLVGRKESPDKNLVRPAQIYSLNGQMTFSINLH